MNLVIKHRIFAANETCESTHLGETDCIFSELNLDAFDTEEEAKDFLLNDETSTCPESEYLILPVYTRLL